MPIEKLSTNHSAKLDDIRFSIPQEYKKSSYYQPNIMLLSTLSAKGNCVGPLAEKLKGFFNWICSWFSSASNIQDGSSAFSVMEEKIQLGKNFITHCLRESHVRTIADPSCKVAIVAKLNQQIVTQHLTVIGLATLGNSQQLALDQLAQDLTRYGQNHSVQSLDELKIEAYFLKQNPAGLCDIEYQYQTQYSGSGHDHCPGLSQMQTTHYFVLKYGNESSHRSDFLRFMMIDP